VAKRVTQPAYKEPCVSGMVGTAVWHRALHRSIPAPRARQTAV